MSVPEAMDFSDLEAKFAVPPMDSSFDNVIVIDQLPKVDDKKCEKLIGVLKKQVFGPVGATAIVDFQMPMDEASGLSKGYMFIEFSDVEHAEQVLKAAHGYRLDKNHVLYAFRFTDFDRLAQLEEEFKPPKMPAYKEFEYLRSWLLDEQGRDQFAIQWDRSFLGLYWNNRKFDGMPGPVPVEVRDKWSDSGSGLFLWSPWGTYLVTLHTQGAALWGGPKMDLLGRHSHPNVTFAAFSPGESFLVTQSSFTSPDQPNILVWDTRTGLLLRTFCYKHDENDEAETVQVRFSCDDRWMSRLVKDEVQLFESDRSDVKPVLKAVTEKLALPNVRSVVWSPSKDSPHHMAFWCGEAANVPARLGVFDLKARVTVRAKNLFSVAQVRPTWHPSGKYLVGLVDRAVSKSGAAAAHSGKARPMNSSIECFRMTEKGIPIDVVEVQQNVSPPKKPESSSSAISAGTQTTQYGELAGFEWEGRDSDRFVTWKNTTDGIKSHVFIGTVAGKRNDVSAVEITWDEDRKPLNKCVWSPRGEMLCVASLGTTGAFLELLHVPGPGSSKSGNLVVTSVACKEHYFATDVAWDPSGSLLASWVSIKTHSQDNGVSVWDSVSGGELLWRQPQSKLLHFAWRPRPPCPLDAEAVARVKGELKRIAARFEASDAAQSSRTTGQEAVSRQKLLADWIAWRKSCSGKPISDKLTTANNEGKQIEDKDDDEASKEWIEEWVEEVVEEIEEVLPPNHPDCLTED